MYAPLPAPLELSEKLNRNPGKLRDFRKNKQKKNAKRIHAVPLVFLPNEGPALGRVAIFWTVFCRALNRHTIERSATDTGSILIQAGPTMKQEKASTVFLHVHQEKVQLDTST